MTARLFFLLLIATSAAFAGISADVRAALSTNDFAQAKNLLRQYQQQLGSTPEWLEAYSWQCRAALQLKKYDDAERYAAETRKMALAQLKTRKLDAERNLPLALGAAIEVEGQVMAARGERDQAVVYLRQELAAYRNTSLNARIQKNINLLSLEGKPAPALETAKWLGPKPPTLSSLKGKPILLFFWAHWCSDCKTEIPIIAQLRHEFSIQGLAVIGPTQHYGYVEQGREAGPEEELGYIDRVRQQFYAPLIDMPAPVSEQNFKSYGCSTTPTIVLIDRRGIVKMYHPGAMSYQDLRAQVQATL
jgi:thiol-disulfide isomerase/thioredoxin